jgi:hypothetical protein
MTDIPKWHIAGDWFDNCSCVVACPCTFAQPPDNGFCESVSSGISTAGISAMSTLAVSASSGLADGRAISGPAR